MTSPKQPKSLGTLVPPLITSPVSAGTQYSYAGPVTQGTTVTQAPDPERTCKNCIFFVPKNNTEAIDTLTGGGVIHADVCSRLNRVLSNGNSKQVTDKLQADIAENCTRFTVGARQPEVTITDTIKVGESIDINYIPSESSTRPLSCNTCQFYTNATRAYDGSVNAFTSLNVCNKFGIAISYGKSDTVASTCGAGRIRETGAETLVPNIKVMSDLISDSSIDSEISGMDPLDYETDADVTDEDKSFGIKAWRTITDAEGDNSVLIPVFDPDTFTDEERVKIPRPGDQEHPELYIDHHNLVYKMAAIWALNETPNLIGVAGTGKTMALHHVAYLMQLPFERVSVTASMEIDQLAGHAEYSPDKGTYFTYGRVPKAWSSRCVILIDEPNVGPPEVWQFLRPLTDNSKQLVLDMNKGERVERNKHCYMGMAMNPAWDSRNVGTRDISDADGRRLMHIYVPMPSKIVEKQIIKQYCKLDDYDLSDKILLDMDKIANDIRELCANDTLPIQWGIAQQIKVARATKYFNLKESYRLAIADLLDPESKDAFMAVITSNVKQSY